MRQTGRKTAKATKFSSHSCEQMRTALLYSRQGCHLCNQAAEVLARCGVSYDTIDIDTDPQLARRYGECVPVVVIDGRERFRGRVDERLLRRLLTARPNG
ncbi:MAG TPA: glutaredoxin family protein [Pirellulales bacterium]|jgi:glutaredoxin